MNSVLPRETANTLLVSLGYTIVESYPLMLHAHVPQGMLTLHWTPSGEWTSLGVVNDAVVSGGSLGVADYIAKMQGTTPQEWLAPETVFSTLMPTVG